MPSTARQNAICRKGWLPRWRARECVDCPLGICDTNGIGFGARFQQNICSFDPDDQGGGYRFNGGGEIRESFEKTMAWG